MKNLLNPWLSCVKNIWSLKRAVRTTLAKFSGKNIFWCSSIICGAVNCDGVIDINHLKEQHLSRDQCIRQACLLSVNAASTLLTTTLAALLDICNTYKDSLNNIVFLLEQAQALKDENSELWDSIIEARSQVNRAKASVIELHSYMETVEKVVTSTTEAAFLAGAEYMCTTLCERLYSAQREIKSQIDNLKQLEETYLKMQKEIVTNSRKECDMADSELQVQ